MSDVIINRKNGLVNPAFDCIVAYAVMSIIKPSVIGWKRGPFKRVIGHLTAGSSQ